LAASAFQFVETRGRLAVTLQLFIPAIRNALKNKNTDVKHRRNP